MGTGCVLGVKTPDKAAYVQAADDVCQTAKDDLEDEEKDLAEQEKAGQIDGEVTLDVARHDRWVRSKIVPIYQRMENELRGLVPPEGDGAYLGDIYDDMGRLITQLNSTPAEGRDLLRQDKELIRRFDTYGMEVCGRV